MPRSPASLRWVIALLRSIEVKRPSTISGSPVSWLGFGTLQTPQLTAHPVPRSRNERQVSGFGVRGRTLTPSRAGEAKQSPSNSDLTKREATGHNQNGVGRASQSIQIAIAKN